jgi:hypothetical protein
MNKKEFSNLVRFEVRRAIAKARPETLFEQVFYDLRVKAKDLKNKWEKDSGSKLENTLLADLASQNINVLEHKFSLGKYRGSRFVTSFKLKIKVADQKEAENLVSYLKQKYSPKWRLNKISEDGIAELNVRGTDMNKQKVSRELLHIAGMLRTAFDSDRAYRDMKKLVDEAYDTFKDYRKEAEGNINDRKVKLLDKMEWDLADVIDDLEKFKRMDD